MGINYLIDTHIMLWWFFDDPKLDTECRNIICNPDHLIFVSSVSACEIATKYRIGKLPEAKQIVEEYSQILHRARFVELPMTSAHALRAGSLPIAHRDPFDRMIMAQAELESLPVITYDTAFQTGLIQVIPNHQQRL
ncbi:type II toxin-antitoxin system VapC family toxin [Dolichospermum sp. ST_sed1]|nr:type II toxin-antitoxin system VapC family toxin [Dolichospermum sp. ST_sed1]MDD1426286.1 type II toxin-antitoxin system VapC family toxin [Dolichospermum sp. ST_sed9]MDD1433297.1 type II toxin-antitoxin system VapC family toxin [Dolichospermum sp. ST_sed6]MDD1442179.1 type II toxin-antitoxin system VapC family toxin [Dolichospermum sp. ST_sed3]MDD1444574.1 type II toxin-antitoxin system VapC family toxin [Dolichospermum sp. ST_sed8]MDD1456630.1 type II toxin-antitoxin system VapC family to